MLFFEGTICTRLIVLVSKYTWLWPLYGVGCIIGTL